MRSLSSLFPLLSVSIHAEDPFTVNAEAEIDDQAIADRIRTLRKGELVVKAAPGAHVEVKQIKHGFPFGTAIADGLAENDEDAISPDDRPMFLKILKENFNYAVHENALKWYDCEKEEGKVDYTTADRVWELCRERGIPMRGHCVYWEKEHCCMDWLKPLPAEQLRAAVVRRGLDVARHFKGRIKEFDLNNEMVNGDFFRRRLGPGVVNEMAWIVKAGNPDAVLYVNEYGILYDAGFNIESYEKQIETFLASGVPIDGIGLQAHFGTNEHYLLDPVRVQRTLNRFARFKLPIKITECLFDTSDEKTQAEQLRTIFPLYFAHPAVEAIIMWGFWAGSHWRPWSALWRKNWTMTPQGEAYRDLVFNQWWTTVSGKAGRDGIFKTQAFFGTYDITVNGKKKEVTFEKSRPSCEVVF